MTIQMAEHPDSWVEDERMSKVIPPYRKSHDFQGEYIDPFHEVIATASGSGLYAGPIKGSLRVADALKLYELAYFANGDILELGSYHGLSCWLMSQALRNANASHHIISIDLSPSLSQVARENIKTHGLEDIASFVTAEGAEGIRQLAAQGRRFSFAFIDHSHRMEHVLSACLELPGVMNTGSPIAFHDFNDRRNVDPAEAAYGVSDGVRRAQDAMRLEFRGVYGCLGLYQFHS